MSRDCNNPVTYPVQLNDEYEELNPDLQEAAEVIPIGEPIRIDLYCNTIYRVFHIQKSAANLSEMKISEYNLDFENERFL